MCDVKTGALDICHLMECPTGEFCIDSIPDEPCSTIPSPSCPLTSIIVTQKFDANVFCSVKRKVGRYQHPNDKATCKKYVNCFLNDGLKGAEYKCLGATLFDPVVGACMTNYVCTGI